MKRMEYVERACLGKSQGTHRDKSHLTLGFVLAAVLVLSQANCSSRSSSSVPSPPTPPTPPSSSTPTTEKTAPAGNEESTEKSREESGSRTSSEETAAVSSPESSETSRTETGSESSSPSPSETPPAAGAAGGGQSSELEQGSAPSEGASTGRESSPGGAASGGAQTTEERTDNLDGKLDASLTEFDGILLKEQEILDERREAAGEQSLDGGYGATGEEQSGSEVSGGRETGGEDQEYAQGGPSGGSPDAPAGEDSESAPGESMGGDPTQMDSRRVPPDVGDGSDDDIVARQLREAAMKEEDPELREKLWDEYRAYKKGMKDN